MILLYILLTIVLLSVFLLFTAALKIIFVLNSDTEDVNLTLLWLYPFVKAVVNIEDTKLVLNIFLFKKSIYRRILNTGNRKPAKMHTMDLVRQIKPSDIHVDATYGFRDPFVTGIACGAVNAASRFIRIASLDQHPDFITERDFIRVHATAKLNPGSTLLNLYRAYIANPWR